MRIGASLILIAIGAILKFAVTASMSGIDLNTVGVILMMIGGVGLIISVIFVATRGRIDVLTRGSAYGVVQVMRPSSAAHSEPDSRR